MDKSKIPEEKKKSILKRLQTLSAKNDKVHIISKKGRWAIKSEGTSRAYRIFDKKSDAINRAQEIINKRPQWDLVIHKKDGSVAERRSQYKKR